MADPLFVDTLDIWLAVLAWGLLTAAAWVTYRFVMGRGQQADRGFGYAFLAIGVYALVMGLWGSMTWPLPSSYNIVLMDPYALYGVALLMIGLALIAGVDLKGPTIAIAFLSISVLIYAADIAKYHLTNSPAAAAALFVLVGLSGILGPFLNLSKSSKYVAYLEVILLVLAALLSAYIGGMATFEHTADWAKWVPFYG
ncbi:DUF981 family protein [Acidilobus saccharovorans]|uniref:DUF981 family protein n=1 Tax=Acidilobus saccharovorans TaxID=242703 RepID=UPI000AE561A8|nr:DUF981 domain-containing protein [Acidilobus saccharovorans]